MVLLLGLVSGAPRQLVDRQSHHDITSNTDQSESSIHHLHNDITSNTDQSDISIHHIQVRAATQNEETQSESRSSHGVPEFSNIIQGSSEHQVESQISVSEGIIGNPEEVSPNNPRFGNGRRPEDFLGGVSVDLPVQEGDATFGVDPDLNELGLNTNFRVLNAVPTAERDFLLEDDNELLTVSSSTNLIKILKNVMDENDKDDEVLMKVLEQGSQEDLSNQVGDEDEFFNHIDRMDQLHRDGIDRMDTVRETGRQLSDDPVFLNGDFELMRLNANKKDNRVGFSTSSLQNGFIVSIFLH